MKREELESVGVWAIVTSCGKRGKCLGRNDEPIWWQVPRTAREQASGDCGEAGRKMALGYGMGERVIDNGSTAVTICQYISAFT